MSKKNFFALLLFTACIVWAIANTAEAGKPYCGDGNCNSNKGETELTCPQDCAGGSVCGDNTCAADETCSSCEKDCGSCPPPTCNNDGVCNAGEDCYGCPDCIIVQGGTCEACFKGCDGECNPKKEGPDCADCAPSLCCGLDTCNEALCGVGCGTSPGPDPECGNEIKELGEDCDDGGESVNCDADCTVAICGDGTLNMTAGEECDDGNINSGDGCDENCINEALSVAPLNQFNIGDSIGEGEAADGTIGEAHHDKVWSTGYDINDIVFSMNERFEDEDPVYYNENSVTMDAKYNKAISGAMMSDFVYQANNVVAEASAMGDAGMITILLGNNDVCELSLDSMTDPELFASQYRAGLDVLAASPYTKYAEIHVSSIPDIYWLWVAKKDSSGCRLVWWFGSVCQALLQNPGDDCESVESRDDPDSDYPGDGPNCKRRKDFHRSIRDDYNTKLKDVLENEYIDTGKLPNAYYVDIFDVKFTSSEVNNGDCFHPSTAGHKLLADEEWCRSLWSIGDPLCTP